MNMKKIICLGMSVAMAAALAVPACAADAVNEDYGNTTDIVLKYAPSDTPYDDYDPEADGAFTITIPSKINLTATDNGEDGVILGGTGTVKLSGMIGQNDYVHVDITSTNNYQLFDKATGESVASYAMRTTTDEDNGIELLHYSKDMEGYYFCSVGTADFPFGNAFNEPSTMDFANSYAKGFQSGSTITMTFENNGPNDIFGKGEYNDTLTFDYEYMTADSENDEGYKASSASSINVNNGIAYTDPQDDFDEGETEFEYDT